MTAEGAGAALEVVPVALVVGAADTWLASVLGADTLAMPWLTEDAPTGAKCEAGGEDKGVDEEIGAGID